MLVEEAKERMEREDVLVTVDSGGPVLLKLNGKVEGGQLTIGAHGEEGPIGTTDAPLGTIRLQQQVRKSLE